MATELFPPKERTIAAVSHEFLWALGGAILPGWAYVFRQWRHLQIAVSLPTILGFVLIWSVSQSVGNIVAVAVAAVSSFSSSFLVTGRIPRSGKLPVLIYSQAKNQHFRPAWASRCTDLREIWHDQGASGSVLTTQNLTPIRARGGNVAPKVENFHFLVKGHPGGANRLTDIYNS